MTIESDAYNIGENGANVPALIQLPTIDTAPGEQIKFGKIEVIYATNSEACVDPREFVQFARLDKRLADFIGVNPNVTRSRYSFGAERSPGASEGKAMALAAAVPGLSPERAVDLVREWEESEGRTFTIHEDYHTAHTHTHAQHPDEETQLGCGHIDKASMPENEGLYQFPSAKVSRMTSYIANAVLSQLEDTVAVTDEPKQKGISGDTMQVVNSEESGTPTEMIVEAPMLGGPHEESAVLIVLSEKYTVMSTDGEHKFFRFDKTRHDASLDRLAEFVRAKGISVTVEALRVAAEVQRNATLSLLAAGLPIFEINLLGDEPQVVFKGFV